VETFPDDYAALRAVHAYLEPLFAADGVYGTGIHDNADETIGADVLMAIDEEDGGVNRAGLAYLLIELQEAVVSEWSSGASLYRMLTAQVSACANDFSGAQSGAANDVSAHERMSRDLVADIASHYTTWRELGLLGVTINAEKPVVALAADEAPGTTVIPHRVVFHYKVT